MWVYLVAALAIGVVFSQQPAINASLAQSLGSPLLGATVSIFISLVGVLILLPLFGYSSVRPSSFIELPWWSVMGGIAGTAMVLGGLMIVPVTGVAVFFLFVVAGQLFGAAIADQIGAFGLSPKPITPLRATGLALVLLGAVLVKLD